MFDRPVEEAIEWLFYNAFRTIGGEQAVGRYKHGHEHKQDSTMPAELKKEL